MISRDCERKCAAHAQKESAARIAALDRIVDEKQISA
jgi:hypothetical protein